MEELVIDFVHIDEMLEAIDQNLKVIAENISKIDGQLKVEAQLF